MGICNSRLASRNSVWESLSSPVDPLSSCDHIYEVNHRKPVAVHVQVVQGRHLTTPWSWNLATLDLHVDPYVVLKLDHSPSKKRETSVKSNNSNPEWRETFTFLVDPDKTHTLDVYLKDSNYGPDTDLASWTVDLSPLPVATTLKLTLRCDESSSELDIEISAEVRETSDLRYGSTLCQEELLFRKKRKTKILKLLKKIKQISSCRPDNIDEVPVIAVIGSGGGFRAMTSFCGAMTGLSELGVFDLAMYVSGVSGSTWYLSHLYSHPEWPDKVSVHQQREQLKTCIDNSQFLASLKNFVSILQSMSDEKKTGQPVTAIEFYGHMLGYTLLSDRPLAKLSDQRKAVGDGQCPLPLYTCIRVNRTMSALRFHEWMELSPFEIGVPKYGTFMKTEHLDCKFFMGSIDKVFPEPPLHFHLGVWGSAFSMQWKRVLQERLNLGNTDIGQSLMGTPLMTGLLERRISAKTFNFQRGLSFSSRNDNDKQGAESTEGTDPNGNSAIPGELPSDDSDNDSDDEYTPTDTDTTEDIFGNIFEVCPPKKKSCLVDAGLAFNSPYPPVLRRQREVDIILSYEFSDRDEDEKLPFHQLQLAARWAELHGLPFPPIDPEIVEREGFKECYVFKDDNNPSCPVVLHFCLVNNKFREEIRPGVPRTTQEEKDFADFDIFNDPKKPYSSFDMSYSNREFDRLASLMEYNTLASEDAIFDAIRSCIAKKKKKKPSNS